MHPAASLILFTTFSGAGFGLLAALGLRLGPTAGWPGLGLFVLAFALATAGLASSTAHLGRPERALKAFREWRSSWLSREAWLAAATLTVAALYALLAIFGLPLRPLGLLTSALAIATVTATAMIYASLRTVPRWHHPTTPAIFLAHAATAGALLTGQTLAAALLLALLGAAQIATWHLGDARTGDSSPETATGLGHLGRVRQLEPPHTGPSYLTTEMVFKVARKHALRLRVLAVLLTAVLPLLCLLVPYGLAAAVLLHLLGTATARWLFFAEARHALANYYQSVTPPAS